MNASQTVAHGGLSHRAVRRWLLAVWLLILAMVMVGGITRLTGSGLSMVQWRPLMGVLPPLDAAQWHEVFEQYKRSPQYQQVNHWMQLQDFQRIFFWEYLHRLLGRLIGVAFVVPWLYFVLRRRLQGRAVWQTGAAFLLGGLQGVLGWYMVQSGLIDVPEVSHFRLTAHLLLAFAVGQWVLWLWLHGRFPRHGTPSRPLIRRLVVAFAALLLLQTVYGAFMAGTRAGYYYASFPDMHGHYAPDTFFGDSPLHDAVHSPLAIHYLHRALGWLTLLSAFALAAYTWRADAKPAVRRGALWVALLTFVQFNLGALTVVLRVELPWAVAHQGTAFVLLSALTMLVHRTRGSLPQPAA